jgi:hypothetical protein
MMPEHYGQAVLDKIKGGEPWRRPMQLVIQTFWEAGASEKLPNY